MNPPDMNGGNVMGNMGWKTITGAIVAAFGYISDPKVLAILPEKWAGIITAIGGLLAAIGVRHAIAKVSAPHP
jgi:hypothetical protein